jgi:hypothetical protein
MKTIVIRSNRISYATLTADPLDTVEGDFWYRADLDRPRVFTTEAKSLPIVPVAADEIADLPATKITSGTFATDRIPDLDASKITSGSFSSARIGTLSAEKITYGTLGVDRHQLLPNLVGSLGYTKTTFADQNLRTTDTVTFAQVNVGDLTFANKWRITEDPYFGLLLISDKGKKYALMLKEIK